MPNFTITIAAQRTCVVEAEDLATAQQWAENRPGNELFQDPPDVWGVRSVEPNTAGEVPVATVTADGKHEWTWGFD